jgi:hypothetical protein
MFWCRLAMCLLRSCCFFAEVVPHVGVTFVQNLPDRAPFAAIELSHVEHRERFEEGRCVVCERNLLEAPHIYSRFRDRNSSAVPPDYKSTVAKPTLEYKYSIFMLIG